MRRLKLLALVLLTSLFIACNKNGDQGAMLDVKVEADMLSEYFDAATTGFISAHEQLRYLLSTPINKEISDNDLQGLIKLNPAVEGLVSLTEGSVLSFVPSSPLKANTAYQVTLKLSTLDKSYKDITYTIHTFKQDILVEQQGFIIKENGKIELQAIVSTADKSTEEEIRKCFTADATNITITAQDTRRFSVNFEYPANQASKAKIQYDATPIGGESKGALENYDINTSSFNVGHTSHDGISKELKVYFSQRLNPSVDLTGLVLVAGADAKYGVSDNVLTIYLAEYTTNQDIVVSLKKGIAGQGGQILKADEQFTIQIEVEKPEIAFLDEGYYFPSTGDFKIPVKARGLESVNVMVLEIKPQNVNTFLTWQSLEYTDYYSMRMYAKPIFYKNVKLDKGITDADGWRTYGIDLNSQIKKNPGSIYHIALDFTPEDVSLACKSDLLKNDIKSKLPGENYFYNWEGYYRDYYYYSDYSWEERDNPCNLSFYVEKYPISRTFICSNFGIIAKQSSKGYHFAVNQLMDLTAVSGANITLFDLQNEVLGSGKTDAQGFCDITSLKRDAGVAKVEKGSEITYIKLNPAESNTLTEFAVQGSRSAKDAELFLYTDRDVWRPGDSIYLDVMVNKNNLSIPDGVPIVCSFYNPDNLLLSRKTLSLKTADRLIYSFIESTSTNAKTGAYRFVVEAGPKQFSKRIRIETIKPNTTEVTYNFAGKDGDFILSDKISGSATVSFLTGFEVAGATVQVTARPSLLPTPFPKFKDFHFGLYQRPEETSFTMSSFTSNAQGQASFSGSGDLKIFNAPIILSLETESTLKGGGTNKQGNSVKVSPFTSYVGVQKLDGSGWSGNHPLQENVKFTLLSLDQKGNKSTSSKKINIEIQKRLQSWWIDKYMLRSGGFYYDAGAWQQVKNESTTTNAGNANYTIAAGSLEEGAYHVVFTDVASGQKSDSYFTIYNQNANIPGSQPYIIQFDSDKEEVEAGQEVKLNFPKIPGARALVSIERANTVIDKFWVDLGSDGEIAVKTTADWAPNVYIHATVVQPYMQDNNDLPLRMYGIKPLQVNSNSKELQPVASLSDKLESNQTYNFTVSEAKGRAMEYTYALVDEGLLNLTGFSTPDPYAHFNGDFPLLVKTWDIYQWLMRYFNGKFAGILSIGGDDAYNPDAIPEISRFKPIVIHSGSFKISAGGKNTHSVSIPNYVGKLRLMIVAANATDFGKLSKAITVKNPLMVQSQLPRALNVTDKVQLPVNVMRDDKSISKVTLETKSNAAMVKGITPSVSLNFSGSDQMTQNFTAEVLNKPGKLSLDFLVKGGGKQMTEHTDILVNYPNSYETDEQVTVIEPGQNKTFTITPKGYKEAFTSAFVISGQKIPSFAKYADELIDYPYGCLEQTVSTGFSQLHLDKVVALEPEQNQKRLANLEGALNKLQRFQHSDGRFYYWDNSYYHAWADIYAGDFLMEYKNVANAQRMASMTDSWIKAHTNVANTWSAEGLSNEWTYEYESAVQAYRLFVLAKSGKAAKSAMNRFVASNKSKQAIVWWLMAGAHKFASYDSKATEFVNKAEGMQMGEVSYNTFGSQARNLALAVEVLGRMPELSKKADLYYDQMVDEYNKSRWLSTQDKGAAFKAALSYFGAKISTSGKVSYAVNGPAGNKSFEVSSFESKKIGHNAGDFGKTYTVSNKGKTALYVKHFTRFISSEVIRPSVGENLGLTVLYNGSSTVPTVKIGEDIIIAVTVNNPLALAQSDLALNVKMPSGWELLNPRLYATSGGGETAAGATYQDFRDDRVYTFFDLGAGDSKTFTFKAKAAFMGDFFLQAVSVENMYKGTQFARSNTGRASIVQ